uniref:Uncharacterized protein n=1 Tax=Aegilops tauschii subsp. strangulata TaxID=200361 RepID=A0A452Z2F6_AEGTS
MYRNQLIYVMESLKSDGQAMWCLTWLTSCFMYLRGEENMSSQTSHMFFRVLWVYFC